MHYNKPPTTWEEQAEILLNRGLIADKALLIQRLKAVNYYRLSAYLFPYRKNDNTFKKGTTIELIWKTYTFDRRLRLIVLDAIERFEISVKTQLTYFFVHKYGAFGYTDRKNLPKLTEDQYNTFLKKIEDETERSNEKFIKHFKQKYGDFHKHLPLWMISEIMSFGLLLSLFRGIEPGIKKQIAGIYRITDIVLLSWLVALNGIRNICAHHSRLWNRTLGYKPRIPKHDKRWHKPIEIQNYKVFAILSILKYLINIIAPQSSWDKRLFKLFDAYAAIPKNRMGFPGNWQDSSIWKGQA